MTASNNTTEVRIGFPLPADLFGELLGLIGERWPTATLGKSDKPDEWAVIHIPGEAVDATDTHELFDVGGDTRPFPNISNIRPRLLLGDLHGPEGNVFCVRGRLGHAMSTAGVDPAVQGAFHEAISDMPYEEMLDLVRGLFAWMDDDTYDDPRFTAQCSPELDALRESLAGPDNDDVRTFLAIRNMDRREDRAYSDDELDEPDDDDVRAARGPDRETANRVAGRHGIASHSDLEIEGARRLGAFRT